LSRSPPPERLARTRVQRERNGVKVLPAVPMIPPPPTPRPSPAARTRRSIGALDSCILSAVFWRLSRAAPRRRRSGGRHAHLNRNEGPRAAGRARRYGAAPRRLRALHGSAGGEEPVARRDWALELAGHDGRAVRHRVAARGAGPGVGVHGGDRRR